MRSFFPRLLLFVCTFCTLFPSFGEKAGNDYDANWKLAETAIQNDLPKTALQHILSIRDRAAAEDCRPQLLRALCAEFVLQHEISPDSDAVVTRRIETVLSQLSAKDDTLSLTERAIWQGALGRLTGNADLLRASIAHPEVLAAARATDYVPAFVMGSDGHWWNDDLLSLLTLSMLDIPAWQCRTGTPLSYDERCMALQKMRDIYAAEGQDIAVLLTDFYDISHEQLLRRGTPHEMLVGEMIARLRKTLPLLKRQRGSFARTAQDWMAEQEAPFLHTNLEGVSGPRSLRMGATSHAYYPGHTLRIVLSYRNVGRVEWQLRDSRKRTVARVSKDLLHTPSHQEFTDTLSLTLPKAGRYTARLLVDGKVQSTSDFYVSRLAPVFFMADNSRGADPEFLLVDAWTGEPYQGKTEEAADFCYPPYDPPRWHYGFQTDQPYQHTAIHLYTDRAIYRPGQKVLLGGMVYHQTDDQVEPVTGWSGKVTLQDTNRKALADLEVTTDEFGQFSGEFALPSPTIPGLFTLVVNGSGARTTEYFRVEEYRRPTFHILLDAPVSNRQPNAERWPGGYETGDTLTVTGRVETYAGIAIPAQEVAWNVEFNEWPWLRATEAAGSEETDQPMVLTGTVTTDNEGRFTFQLIPRKAGRYAIKTRMTAPDGETAEATWSLTATPHNATETVEAPRPQLFREVRGTDGSETTLIINPAALPCTDTTGSKGTGQPAGWILYRLVSSAKGVIDAHTDRLTPDSMVYHLQWQESYGDGAVLHIAFMHEGTFHRTSVSVERPRPDKRLLLQWTTFRDHLQPGDDETWSLRITHPDGTPADAAVMARLYDATLDAFYARPWHFALHFQRNLPNTVFYHYPLYNEDMSYYKPLNPGASLDLNHWQPLMFSYYGTGMRTFGSKMRYATTNNAAVDMMAPMMKATAAPMLGDSRSETMAMDDLAGEVATEAETDGLTEAETMEAAAAPVRENFDETAFFMPRLRTDADGCVSLNFRLPESLTQWRFTALAFDHTMNYGLLNDTIYAQKRLTAEISAPRFLRAGDRSAIPVTLRNLTEETLTTTVTLLFTDAADGKVLHSERQTLTLAPLQPFTFAPEWKAERDFLIRVVAKAVSDREAQSYSDGEQRLIPVLDGREDIQVSIPFSTTEAGNIRLDLSPLHLKQLMKDDAACRPVLTLEYSANPLHNVVRVIPTLLDGEACNATGWAMRLYAIEVADYLARSLHTPETDSLLQVRDIPALRYAALDHLRQYQRGDGGFCWFPGFDASYWMTTEVCILLARQQRMTGSTTARQMLSRAMEWLQKETVRIVQELRAENSKTTLAALTPSESLLRYLYIRQLLGLAPDKDAHFLLELASHTGKDLTMYGKGVVAQILASEHPQAAALALESLIEHTVTTPEMGRYFDTQRALGGWASYRIPTQTMTLEALQSANARQHSMVAGLPNDRIQDELRLWLLQSKRTQQWESSRASADATYALLHRAGQRDGSAGGSLVAGDINMDEGYRREVLTPSETDKAIRTASYNIYKERPGLAWGALYADYSLPTERVEALSAGFTVTREWQVWRDGAWQKLQPPFVRQGRDRTAVDGGQVKVGERVRQVITIQADRDYDYVQVEAGHAACLEAHQPLSGMTWQDGTTCYRMVRDSRNDYYFQHLSKGTHTLTEELIVSRSGQFAHGIARVTCCYAPEFRGYAPSTAIFATSE